MADLLKKKEDLVKNVTLPETGRISKESLANFTSQLKYGQLCLLKDILEGDPKNVKEFQKVLVNATNDYTYR